VAEAPWTTPVRRIDEVAANRQLTLREDLDELPAIPEERVPQAELEATSATEITQQLRTLAAGG
jgi:hypothetical protein